ncbi:hypothetical protein GCM10025872_26470 [Barrientosiimonas endolithica]|uniref:MobA-like NTP transferase domain-containing protein n=1 Tax=Barrientosiimonas endolithica TaxID=1535208 RepID=A0ABM8HDD5_9MICO|nr:hypothetical protein GCM10025872_26470 [Barrientosiimonas endolithica]
MVAAAATYRGCVTAVDAIVLAGGRSSRFGSDKARLALDGVTMVDRTVAAARLVDPRHVVVVADPELPVAGPVVRTRERPAYAGPAAGVLAGLRAVPGPQTDDGWVLLLGCDTPRVAEAVRTLLAHDVAPDADGVLLVHEGRPQWLLGRYRRGPLLRAADRLGDPTDRALRHLLGDLHLERSTPPTTAPPTSTPPQTCTASAPTPAPPGRAETQLQRSDRTAAES